MGGLVDFYVANTKKYDSYQTMVQNLSPDVVSVQGFSNDGKQLLELFVHNDNGRLIVSNDPGKKNGTQ